MGSSQTSTTTNNPWAPSEPMILSGLNRAQTMFESNPNQFEIQPWDGPFTAGEDPALQYARDVTIGNAGMDRHRINQATDRMTDIGMQAQGNVNDPRFQKAADINLSSPVAAPFTSTMTAETQATAPSAVDAAVARALPHTNDERFNDATMRATGGNYSQNLSADLRQSVMEDVMPGMNATFANSGMTGSSLHQQNLAKGLASGMARENANLINQAEDRALQAAGMRQGAMEAHRGAALDAGGLALNAENATANRRMTAAGNLNAANEAMYARQMAAGNAAQEALMGNRSMALGVNQATPGMVEAGYAPMDRVADIGQARTDTAQLDLAGQIQADQQRQAAPIEAVNNYISLVGGLGSGLGSSATSSRSNPGLLGILGGIGQVAPLFGLSDRRAKTDIKLVGATIEGLGVYTFRYHGDAEIRMGVMADEVEKVRPGAVAMGSDGLKRVDYSQIGEAA